METALAQVFENAPGIPKVLKEAMAYSLYAEGKRLRPILAGAGCEAVGGDRDLVAPLACAIEMIHTYSLIHDDLPAMDNDSLRRGRPTNHKVYGEAIAILAGDSLLTQAFTWLAQQSPIKTALTLEVIADLGHAAGMAGMAGGQVIDLQCEGKSDVMLEELEQLHRLKTGTLLEASASLGAKLVGASIAQVRALKNYGAAIGLAFQIADDILDIEGGKEIGKDVGSDVAKGKTTYPALLGLERSKSLAREWAEKAVACLHDFDAKADPLRQIATYTVERRV